MSFLPLTGPEFVAFYVGLLAAVIVGAGIVRTSLRGPSGDPGPVQLDAYQAAFLAGGFQSAGQAAIAALAARGSLRVDPGGRLVAIEPRPMWLHPVEDAVWTAAAMAGAPGPTAPALVAAARPALGPVQDQLRRLGLAMADAKVGSVRTLPALVVLAAAGLGGVRLAFGMAAGRPVGFLIALLVLTVVVALLFTGRPASPRTHRGDHLVRGLRRTNAALRTSAFAAAGTLAGADLALAVGLWGPAVLSGSPLDDVRRVMQPAGASGGSDGGSGGSSCSGGGSSCGGGCGGGCGG